MEKQKGGFKFKGKYRFIKTNSITGELISVSEWIENLIMIGTDTGINLIIQRIGGDTSNDIEITNAKIGTGTTAPTDADTDLQTAVVSVIAVADQEINTDNVILSFFISDASLPNGTYHEFGIFAGSNIFARSIISPQYVKGTNEDTTIEYTITGYNTI